jgi:TetR/AcrR family transcriptional regulator
VTRTSGTTRTALLAAAAAEFAAHGFDGASVDDIARRARVNKAMIYYHFKDKEALYVEILRDVFRGLGARTAAIAAADTAPSAKIEAFIDSLNQMAASHPYMPPVMMRELASGATMLDADTLRLMHRIIQNLGLILDQGARSGAFVRADPVAVYFTVIAPIIFFRATAPVRAAMQRARLVDLKGLDSDAFASHLKTVAITVLAAHRRAAPPPATRRPATPRRRPRPAVPGDHA